MRAFICRVISDDLSGADIEAIDQPKPGPGEALIRVKAAGVNFPDFLMCQGKYQFKPEPPFTPGLEVCGEVVAVGDDSDAAWIGEDVVAGVRMGGFAEYVSAPMQALRAKPHGLSNEAASAYSAAYITALVALKRRARIGAGETLLVHGAAGGVGLACVDLGARLGARVIATASTPEKRAFLEAYGADLVLPSSGFRDGVKDFTNGAGADVIFDPVGGDVFDESVRCIAFGGRLLVIGFTSGRIATISANMPLIKGFSVVGVRAGEYGRRFPDHGREDAQELWDLADQGHLRVHVGALFKLEEAKDALQTLALRRAIGKLVITP
jgi:NADPH2:quinone reductase